MTNIPTELLRTLVAVVDLRSFTKAAQSLGVTQPAVSAQIKRLQSLLGGELFDRSAPGVTLTHKGDIVVSYARRLLSINDQILQLAQTASPAPPLRIGIPSELDVAALPSALAEFRRSSPRLRFSIRGESSELLLRDLQNGDLDIAVAFSQSDQVPDARYCWTDDLVWLRGSGIRLDPTGPVPLVACDPTCVLNRVAIATLDRAGRGWEMVFKAVSTVSLTAAVDAGLGVAVGVRRFVADELMASNDGSLPELPPVICGIYLRDGAEDHAIAAPLADAFARAIGPPQATRQSVDGPGPGGPAIELRAGRPQ